ncbi:MAG: CHAT domain-containing protein [Crocosphaera sp.]
MTKLFTQYDKHIREDEREAYLTLRRDLVWREGFGILFVQCTPVQENWIIEKLKKDIIEKNIDILEIQQSTDNLYDLIAFQTQDRPVDILLIKGLEKPLKNYVDFLISDHKNSYKFSHFPPLLAHLNWQRERFRDDFNLCLVFLVRDYILKYLVRRSPDFFDWRSGVFKFPVSKEIGLLRSDNLFSFSQNQEITVETSNENLAKIPEDYLTFLIEILEAEFQSNSDYKIIYSVLQDNIDKLDETFARLIQQWLKYIFTDLKSEEQYLISGLIENLCIDIAQFPLGNIANNLEIAITGLTTLLRFYSFERFSEQWARLQTLLGTVYNQRIRGDKAENLEKAISFYHNALKVYTSETFPQEWATVQNNLATTYTDRIRGDKADNLEQAIYCYQNALKVKTFDSFPIDWAMIMNNLGTVYSNRIRGDKAENLEKGISYYNQALTVYTLEAFPERWATLQNNLATAYTDRIRGDKVDNLEQAIYYYQNALKVRTVDAFPYGWAETHNNLALAYLHRIRGDKADNLERAIISYQNALKIRTVDAFPYDWAETQNNLGNAYLHCISADEAEKLEKAIYYYQNALKVRTFDAFPYDWAETQNNLGNAYLHRIRGDKAENLERAIISYQNALKVRTFDAFPYDWAETQNNLGNAYLHRIRGDKAENLEKAIYSYQNALNIYQPKDLPLNCLETARALGNLYYNEKQWHSAIEAYDLAIQSLENALLEALNPQSRQEILSNNINIFHRIVQVYLNLNQPEKALEYIERSKGRNLVELMTQKQLKPQGVSQETIDQLAELKQQVINEKIRIQHQTINQNLIRSDNLNPYLQDYSYLRQDQQELDTFVTAKITPYDPTFSLTQKVQPITFEEIQYLTDDSTCLLQWYITEEKILAFIVSSDETVKVWQSSEEGTKQFIDTFANYLQLYYSETGRKEWMNLLPDLLQTFANILHINEIISLIPETCQSLIIIPHWFLHILPIHALPINNSALNKGGWGGSILQDKYDIQYAPSSQLLNIIKQRKAHNFNRFLAIQNPNKYLFFTDLEVNIISTLFNQKEILKKDEATKVNVIASLKSSDSDCIHFSCHSEFNHNNPLESALSLANKEVLTLGEIFELDLRRCSLVVFSACETGFIDFQSPSDECLSIATACLFAGTSSVISSLWTVSDLSTAFLMIKFYEILLDENQQVSVAVALKTAQNWLRNLTNEEFKQEIEKLQPQISQILSKSTKGRQLIVRKQIEILSNNNQTYPFANPYYWAAFGYHGV